MRELERNIPASPEGLPPMAVTGRGRMGQAIASAASAAGLVASLAGREDARSAYRAAEVALLCVPDSEIRFACAEAADATPPLRFVGHTSGATALDALDAAATRGAVTFSIHPLQTIPDGGASLAGSPAAIAGSNGDGLMLARDLALQLGLVPFEVPDAARAAYHAAACISSNFLIALEQTAVELLARAGIEDGRELLAPLVMRTAANWAERGADALTGPIARGDEQTVSAHLAAIERIAPELADTYRTLAERTEAIANRERVRA